MAMSMLAFGPALEGCLASEVLNRIGDKWSVYAIARLGDGTLRFSDSGGTTPQRIRSVMTPRHPLTLITRISTTTADPTAQSATSRRSSSNKPTTLPSTPGCSQYESGTKLGTPQTHMPIENVCRPHRPLRHGAPLTPA
jgi:hypothetical protein